MTPEQMGAFIRHKRKELGMTQTQLADRVGICLRTMRSCETGEHLLHTRDLLSLCRALRVSPNQLFGWSKKKKTEQAV